MSKIQGAISQLLTSAKYGIGVVKGIQKTQEQEKLELAKQTEIERREAEKTAKIEASKKAQEQKEFDEATEVAKRVAMKRLGVSDESIERYIQSERLGTLNPRLRMRGDKGLLSFTQGTTARRMADMSLAGATYNKALTDTSYRQRLLAMGKNTKERVKNVLIAEKGAK